MRKLIILRIAALVILLSLLVAYASLDTQNQHQQDDDIKIACSDQNGFTGGGEPPDNDLCDDIRGKDNGDT